MVRKPAPAVAQGTSGSFARLSGIDPPGFMSNARTENQQVTVVPCKRGHLARLNTCGPPAHMRAGRPRSQDAASTRTGVDLGSRASCPLEHTGGPSAGRPFPASGRVRAGRPRSQGALRRAGRVGAGVRCARCAKIRIADGYGRPCNEAGVSAMVARAAASMCRERGRPARPGLRSEMDNPPEARVCPCGRDARAPGCSHCRTNASSVRRGGSPAGGTRSATAWEDPR